tara:strand:- start:997 stop:1329 length:333 start_codon:yes stop_codon:yes gene_type:complete
MKLHQDATSHQWIKNQWWDLIVTIDNAASEIYCCREIIYKKAEKRLKLDLCAYCKVGNAGRLPLFRSAGTSGIPCAFRKNVWLVIQHGAVQNFTLQTPEDRHRQDRTSAI